MPVPQHTLMTERLRQLPDQQPRRDNDPPQHVATSSASDEAAYALDDVDTADDDLIADGPDDNNSSQPYDLDAHDKKRALAKLSEVSRRRSAVRDGEFVESDLCGRGDPRVFDEFSRRLTAVRPRLDGDDLNAIANIQSSDGVRYTSSRHMSFHKRVTTDGGAKGDDEELHDQPDEASRRGATQIGLPCADDTDDAPGRVTASNGAHKRRKMRLPRDADTAAGAMHAPQEAGQPPASAAKRGDPTSPNSSTGVRQPVKRTLSFPFRRSRSLYEGVCRLLRKRRGGPAGGGQS